MNLTLFEDVLALLARVLELGHVVAVTILVSGAAYSAIRGSEL